jgi:hypothetical protein
MKNFITVSLDGLGKFVLTETRLVVQNTVIVETDNTAELTTAISNLTEYKRAQFTEDAKSEFKRIEKEAKMANKLKNDVKRQEREAKKAERKQAQEAKLIERMAKLQAQLEKVKSA